MGLEFDNLPCQDRLAVAHKKLKALQRQACLQKRRDRNCGLTDWAVKAVVSSYMLSNYDMDLAQRVGQMMLKRQAKVGTRSGHSGPLPVRDWFTDLPIETFNSVLLPATAADRHLCREVDKLICEVRTMRWVRDENFRKGVAPASADVALQFAEVMGRSGQGVATDALARSARANSRDGQRTVRQWARRFRNRWRATHAQLSTQDAPPRGTLGAKAGASMRDPRSLSLVQGFLTGMSIRRVQVWVRNMVSFLALI